MAPLKMQMDISLFSNDYIVRRMEKADVADIYLLCSKQGVYYQYCPPFVTEQSILDDMNALPPNKEICDKYYVGYYKGEELIAVMDFIMAYPDEKTAFIGFFMTAASIQNTGIGSSIIDDLCRYLADIGLLRVRLSWVKGNPQAEHFGHKNDFKETGITYDKHGCSSTSFINQDLIRGGEPNVGIIQHSAGLQRRRVQRF